LAGAVDRGAISINGQQYLRSVFQGVVPVGINYLVKVQYVLNSKCDQFTYTAGVTDNSPTDTVIEFDVYGDSQKLWSSQLAYGQSAQKTVSVQNVVRLTLQSIGLKGTGDMVTAGWGDAAVRCSSSPSYTSTS